MRLFTHPNGLAGGQRARVYMEALGVPFTKEDAPDITHVMHYNYNQDISECPRKLYEVAERVGTPIINERLLTITKDHVDDVFSEIFGYSLRIDPTKHYGTIVRKTNQNAVHGMRLFQGPLNPIQLHTKPMISKTTGYAYYMQYQRFLDTRIDAETLREFRAVVIGGEVVLLMEKHIDSRCLSHPQPDKKFDIFLHWDIPSHFFSRDEQEKIQQFINNIGADFCELDILRDNSSGLAYIIDCNPVPCGGPIFKQHPEAVHKLANIFKERHLS